MYIYFLTDEKNDRLYIGVPGNLERRIREHRESLIDGYTKRYGLKKLVYVEEWSSTADAIQREKQLKGWRREKKNFLVNALNPSWEELMPWQ